jgi:sigma-E factor negative regulatory protein RseC
MITETATVISVEDTYLLVETIQQSTCGNCSAQKGCGQGVLAKYLSSASLFRIALHGEDGAQFKAGDTVELGIDELALVRASLWLYLVPLAGLIVGAYLGSLYSQLTSILFAALGMAAGGYLSWMHSIKTQNDPDYAPMLVTDQQAIKLVEPSPTH